MNGEEAMERVRAGNRDARAITGVPRPFMKWAGGKRQLLSQLDPFIPGSFNTYIEPFVGGGAVFFYLLPSKAVLMDVNPELVNMYRVIRDDVDSLIASLCQHENTETYYYAMRNIDRNEKALASMTSVDRASRSMYLNRTCFNGLYRVNKAGHFNVPFGRYKNPQYCDEENLRAASVALQGVEILRDGFEACLDIATPRDFIYMDPPYVPLSTTSSFTSYAKDNFSSEDQARLLHVFKELDRRGCKVMLSNSHSDLVLELYDGYHIETIMASRAINSVGSKRGKIREVLIHNGLP